jgi:hypothetical protein
MGASDTPMSTRDTTATAAGVVTKDTATNGEGECGMADREAVYDAAR